MPGSEAYVNQSGEDGEVGLSSHGLDGSAGTILLCCAFVTGGVPHVKSCLVAAHSND